MITIHPDYLETFLTWLTGGNKDMVVEVPKAIADAILNSENAASLCYVEWREDKRAASLWWKQTWEDRKNRVTITVDTQKPPDDLVFQIVEAVKRGDTATAMKLQQQMKGR